jgi:transcriptional regulator GlxA family with amidase domain
VRSTFQPFGYRFPTAFLSLDQELVSVRIEIGIDICVKHGIALNFRVFEIRCQTDMSVSEQGLYVWALNSVEQCSTLLAQAVQRRIGDVGAVCSGVFLGLVRKRTK